MNDLVRLYVERELQRKNLSRTEVAVRADLSRQYVTDMLNGRKGEVPESWQRLLDALDLELYVRPKGRPSGGGDTSLG